MNYKYEYIFFKYLYGKLNLKSLDDKLELEGIKPYNKDNSDKRISKYFSLINKGSTVNFQNEELQKYNYYFSKDINELIKEPLYSEVINFISKTYVNYFFSKLDDKYKFYGPSSFEYMAPTDSIILGINYVKYDLNTNDYDNELMRQESVIVDTLNYIQTELAKKHKIKLSAISYNEVVLNQVFKKI